MFGNPFVAVDQYLKGDDSHIRKAGPMYDNDLRPIDNTPINLAGLLLAAAGMLALLKIGGFRFTFGVAAGGR